MTPQQTKASQQISNLPQEKPLSQLLENFSLVTGGPFYSLLVRLGLINTPLHRLYRATFVLVALAWLPLVLLVSLFQDSSAVPISFWQDLEVHIRLLISLPAFLLAEAPIHRALRKTVSQFVDEGIVARQDHSYFTQALLKLYRARDSLRYEGVLFLLVYTLGCWLRWENIAPVSDSWFAVRQNGITKFTHAGLWYSAISIPLLQFIQVRWYIRLGLWISFLRKVARLKLHLTPNHPDRSAGLGFLGDGAASFAPVLFAHGVGLAGMLSDKVIFDGNSLLNYRFEIGASVVVLLLSFLAPLLIFTPTLLRLRWEAIHEFSGFTTRFLQAFNQKWVNRSVSANTVEEEFLSTSDIQNQANISASFDIVSEMRPVPFDRSLIIIFVVATILPMLPLSLTMMSAAELFNRLASALF